MTTDDSEQNNTGPIGGPVKSSCKKLELHNTRQGKEDHWYTKQQAIYRRAMTSDNEILKVNYNIF